MTHTLDKNWRAVDATAYSTHEILEHSLWFMALNSWLAQWLEPRFLRVVRMPDSLAQTRVQPGAVENNFP